MSQNPHRHPHATLAAGGGKVEQSRTGACPPLPERLPRRAAAAATPPATNPASWEASTTAAAVPSQGWGCADALSPGWGSVAAASRGWELASSAGYRDGDQGCHAVRGCASLGCTCGPPVAGCVSATVARGCAASCVWGCAAGCIWCLAAGSGTGCCAAALGCCAARGCCAEG